ncbi:hypothetical protein, partial [Staphylococcus aureus]|uniref:hypothetical protein n=1 Tax=Staphylococcus aureus TaxID=1280 RepID=UPI001E536C38|nr:hypothetical protein [Staphylococcus aureus]
SSSFDGLKIHLIFPIALRSAVAFGLRPATRNFQNFTVPFKPIKITKTFMHFLTHFFKQKNTTIVIFIPISILNRNFELYVFLLVFSWD